jgi:2-(1,2-epoxy-1,2-dihydrophenyl)acetyl-CoA isomerase
MSLPHLLTRHDQGVLVLTLNQPERINAMSLDMIEAINKAIDGAAKDDAVRAVLITGAGRGFCAGADLTSLRVRNKAADGGTDVGVSMDTLFNPMVRKIRALEKPVIAAVNGMAAGGGANLALACDIVLAARSARFTQVFARISLIPDLGGTWFLPHDTSVMQAQGLALTTDLISAEEAERRGLVWQVFDDAALMDAAISMARKLAAGPTVALGHIKRALNQSATNSLAAQLDLERDLQRGLGRTEDFAEGVAAFLQKRAPRYAGR